MELEYKYKLESADEGRAILSYLDAQERILSRREIEMCSRYFDTPSRALRKAGYSLRLRGENDENICCIKRTVKRDKGALRLREEYECKAQSLAEGLEKLRAEGVPAEFFGLCGEGFVLIAQVDFTRSAYLVEKGSACMELAFDRGHFGGDPEKHRFFELEIEFKEGEEADFTAFAQALSEKFGLVPQEKSKLARGIEAEDQKNQKV